MNIIARIGAIVRFEDNRTSRVQADMVAASPSAALVEWEGCRPYLEAFIEGEKGPSKHPDEGMSQMISKMEAPGSLNLMTLFLGPMYWAWRRCYAEAIAYALCAWAFVSFMVIFDLPISSTAVVFGAAFLFYPLYRNRALRVYRRAYKDCDADPARMLEAMRAAGGTSWVGFFTMLLAEAAFMVAFFCAFVVPVLATYEL